MYNEYYSLLMVQRLQRWSCSFVHLRACWPRLVCVPSHVNVYQHRGLCLSRGKPVSAAMCGQEPFSIIKMDLRSQAQLKYHILCFCPVEWVVIMCVCVTLVYSLKGIDDSSVGVLGCDWHCPLTRVVSSNGFPLSSARPDNLADLLPFSSLGSQIMT